MKIARIVGIIVAVLTLCVLGANVLVIALPTWAIRVDGVILLISLLTVSYTSGKWPKNDK